MHDKHQHHGHGHKHGPGHCHEKHEHEHGHKQGHCHEHKHEHAAVEMSVPEKLGKLAEHWISHNDEHAASYRLWATRAREAGQDEPAEILEEIASEMAEQNTKLKRIIDLLAAKSAD